jgi:hypothetical protein
MGPVVGNGGWPGCPRSINISPQGTPTTFQAPSQPGGANWSAAPLSRKTNNCKTISHAHTHTRTHSLIHVQTKGCELLPVAVPPPGTRGSESERGDGTETRERWQQGTVSLSSGISARGWHTRCHLSADAPAMENLGAVGPPVNLAHNRFCVCHAVFSFFCRQRHDGNRKQQSPTAQSRLFPGLSACGPQF